MHIKKNPADLKLKIEDMIPFLKQHDILNEGIAQLYELIFSGY